MLKDTQNIFHTTKITRHDNIASISLSSSYAKPLSDLGICGAAIVTSYESDRVCRGDVDPVHCNLFYLLEGNLLMETVDKDYELKTGDFAIIPSWIHRRFSHQGKQPVTAMIFIVRDNSALLPSLAINQRQATQLGHIHSIFMKLNDELQHDAPYADKITRDYCDLIANYLLREINVPETPRDQEIQQILSGIWEKVGKNIAHKWTVEEMSRFAAISPSYLYMLCQKYMGISPIQKVIQMRMDSAKYLLLNSSANLAEIADHLGYSSEFAFSSAFKKVTGKSPGQFRKTTFSKLP